MASSPKLDIETVILVADVYQHDAADVRPEQRRDLEMSSPETISAIKQGIVDLGLKALHIGSLDELYKRATERRPGDVVLSIFGGERSRNRMALVPAICESLGMRFIGPDTYGRIVCQDKSISKKLAVDCGILTPAHALVRTMADLKRLVPSRFPVVVKPNVEGSSIGISQESVVHDLSQLHVIGASVLAEFGQPVIVEEFVSGREVSFNIIETRSENHERFAEVRLIAQPDYFDDHLFSADIKAPWNSLEVVLLEGLLVESDRLAIRRLAEAVGDLGYCRVDGKLLGGRFQFLELTPDAWLDPRGVFAISFTQTGWRYPELLAHVLASEPEARRRRVSNG